METHGLTLLLALLQRSLPISRRESGPAKAKWVFTSGKQVASPSGKRQPEEKHGWESEAAEVKPQL